MLIRDRGDDRVSFGGARYGFVHARTDAHAHIGEASIKLHTYCAPHAPTHVYTTRSRALRYVFHGRNAHQKRARDGKGRL